MECPPVENVLDEIVHTRPSRVACPPAFAEGTPPVRSTRSLNTLHGPVSTRTERPRSTMCAAHLIPVIEMPRVKYFWATMKTATVGTIASVAPAMSGPYWVLSEFGRTRDRRGS